MSSRPRGQQLMLPPVKDSTIAPICFGNELRKDKLPPTGGRAILGPAANLKAFKELETLSNDEDEEEISRKVDLQNCLEDPRVRAGVGMVLAASSSRGGWTSFCFSRRPTLAFTLNIF